MKNNFTPIVKSLILIFCLGFSISGFSQVQLNYSADQNLVAEGQTHYDVDVRVSDFENIIAAQFMLEWNPNILQIDTVPFISTSLQSFTLANMALPSQTLDMVPGRLLVSWSDPSTFGQTVADNTLLFTMRFNVVGTECDTAQIALGETTNFFEEAIIEDFTDIGFTENLFLVEVAGEGCSTFNTNLACNDEVFYSLDPSQEFSPVTPDMLLEGGPYNYANMTVSPSQVSCNNVGSLTATVTDNTTGNSCWGTLVVQGNHCGEFLDVLVCNSALNVSLSPWSGTVELTPDMLLEGGPYEYNLIEVSPSVLDCDNVNIPEVVTVTHTVTGSTCFSNVILEDKTPPVAIADQNIILQLTENAAGDVSAKLFAETVDEGSYDNCGDITFDPLFWEFDCSDVGTQFISMQVIDQYGNYNSVFTEVTVLPTSDCDGFVAPLVCNSNINISLAPWQVPVDLTADMILEGNLYDESTIVISPAQVDCSDIGTPVTVTVTDTITGNACFSTLTVEDKIAPVAIVKQNVVVALSADPTTGDYKAKVYAEDIDNGSFDNCSEVTFNPAFWEFDCSDIGTFDLTLEVIDAYGNVGTTWSTVTLELKLNSPLNCPDDIIVDCDVDITDAATIENILGSPFVDNGCILPYVDALGYDANEDGDLEDTFMINGESITENHNYCNAGAITRTWSGLGQEDDCVQVIGVREPSVLFDGYTMIDWPYSKNSVASIGDNDSGENCSSNCSAIADSDITLTYDSNGVVTGSTVVTDCLNALCEEPLFDNVNGCNLIGYTFEETFFNMPNGDLNLIRKYIVINWCEFDPAVSETDGKWEFVVNATVIGGASTVELNIPDVTAGKFEQVCLPVKVSNFAEIESFQGSLEWDPTVVSFSSVQSFGVPNLSNSSFGLTATDSGKLSFVWIDQTGVTPASLSDNASLFSACFNVIGEPGEFTSVELVDVPTEIEITSNLQSLPVSLNDGSITVGVNNCINDTKKPTPYCVALSTALMQNGQVTLWAQDFNIGSFDNCTESKDLRYTFSSVNPDNDPNFTQGSSFKQFYASDIGNASSGTVTVQMYVWDESDNFDYCQVSLTLVNDGTVGGNGDVTLKFEHKTALPNTSICMPLKVENFSDIETLQGTIEWDPNVISFTSLQGFNLPSFTASNFNQGNINNGSLSFLWFDNTGLNPANLSDNEQLYEICFDVIGSVGSYSPINFVDLPVSLQVSSHTMGVLSLKTVNGSVTILDSSCSLQENQIDWPTAELSVYAPTANAANASSTLSPSSLLSFAGIDSTDVYPLFNVDAACEASIAWSYQDEVFEIDVNLIKVIRTWNVIDWNTGNLFTFQQVVQNYLLGNLICDTLPNSAPEGDCDSGHTLDDDVEWPDDLFINDHRITPAELISSSGVDTLDSEPIFYNVPELYEATYNDSVGGLSATNLLIKRIWTATRIDFPGQEWRYVQSIDIDLTDFGKLVTVSSISNRPVPEVSLSASDMTDVEGLAYVEGDANPAKIDDLRNGLNIKDLMLMQASILDQVELNEFEELAADYNGDNNVSSLDVFELESILLGLSSDTHVEWMFNDVTTEVENGIEPKGHYVAVKPGDIDDTADIGFGTPDYESEKLIIEDQLLNAGETYMVPLYIGNDIQALGTELNLTFQNNMVEIVSVTSEQVFGKISYNIINDSRLAMITENFDLSVESIDKSTPLLTIEIKALENGVLTDVFGVSQIDESFILDASYNLIKIEELIEGEIILGNEEVDNTLSIDVYPNPTIDYLNIDDNDQFVGDDIRFELFSLAGQRVVNTINEKQVDVSTLVPGMYIYKVTVNDRVLSGRIMKQ